MDNFVNILTNNSAADSGRYKIVSMQRSLNDDAYF